MNKYKFNLDWSEEDEGYIATCPEFPGLSAFGETAEESLNEAQIALKLFIKSYKEDNIPLPQPELLQAFSGQFRLRLPKLLHAQAASLAVSERVSLNSFVMCAVQARVSGNQSYEKIERSILKLVAHTCRPEKFLLANNIDKHYTYGIPSQIYVSETASTTIYLTNEVNH